MQTLPQRIHLLTYIAFMYASLTIVRYPAWLSWAGFLSMALFRLPLFFNKKITFYKLLGCGKNGTFDKMPDLRQWGLLTVFDSSDSPFLPGDSDEKNYINQPALYGQLITNWWRFFNCETWTLLLQPLEGHGYWDGKTVFGDLPKTSDYEGLIAVLTRATIRLNKLKSFWANVQGVANIMNTSPGFITSLGVGEVPWIKQATFSIWQSKSSMKDFAYKMKEHAEVVKKTRQQNWYKEDMFIRFKILSSAGTLNGKNPLRGIL